MNDITTTPVAELSPEQAAIIAAQVQATTEAKEEGKFIQDAQNVGDETKPVLN